MKFSQKLYINKWKKKKNYNKYSIIFLFFLQLLTQIHKMSLMEKKQAENLDSH